MECRAACGACCIVPSISTPIPGMPEGKPANTPCIQLDEQRRCKIFLSPLRPAVCASLMPDAEMCGTSSEAAMTYLLDLERQTAPGSVN
ncbi:YkgJ family cysteine cluster protein [Erwinia oleae]|uniref:YkgJ family cysteine cluster protein n=1 Tax=Erwinia oleae TaxID=796334 RepID=UPI00054E7472|nr:YkgJ family cysteine cluster protein [Erwinia oleae]